VESTDDNTPVPVTEKPLASICTTGAMTRGASPPPRPPHCRRVSPLKPTRCFARANPVANLNPAMAVVEVLLYCLRRPAFDRHP
jgi:hypothetical protein